jgi:predicted RNA-binding protein with PIN domain
VTKGTPEPPEPGLDELPDSVRLRVLSLAADALPDLARLPPSLRRVASFAPSRRARVGATAIGTAVAGDEELRERVGLQVLLRGQRAADELVAAEDRTGVQAAERAALLWLARPEGWSEALAAALRSVADQTTTSGGDDDARLQRLQRKLEDAEQAVRELRAQRRATVEEYKSENASLRRKLGESRAAERAARAEAEGGAAEVEEELAEARVTLAAQDKELRRLRGRVADLESEASAERRSARSERDEATLRARLLLDTVIEAASGLRRELALPAVSGAPADRIEQELAGQQGSRSSASAATETPQAVAQLLSMPRARLIVDGYNVSKTAWPSSSLEAQRVRLLGSLAPLVARTGAETTVVFDAGSMSARPVVNAPRGVRVVFSPEGVIADDVIRDLVAAEPQGRVVVVVSSDRALANDVAGDGARVASSEALLGLLDRGA